MIKDVEPLLKECEETLKDLLSMGETEAACYVQGFINSINKLPEAERPHGTWIDEGVYADNVGQHVYRCTYCNDHIVEYPTELGSYCKYCGSDNRPRILDEAIDGEGRDGNVKEGEAE